MNVNDAKVRVYIYGIYSGREYQAYIPGCDVCTVLMHLPPPLRPHPSLPLSLSLSLAFSPSTTTTISSTHCLSSPPPLRTYRSHCSESSNLQTENKIRATRLSRLPRSEKYVNRQRQLSSARFCTRRRNPSDRMVRIPYSSR